MSRTIGKRKPAGLPRGDYVAMCDYCSANWYRSQLRRDASGLLVCPDEGPGLDSVILDKLNASYRPRPTAKGDGGHYVRADGSSVYYSTHEDIEL